MHQYEPSDLCGTEVQAAPPSEGDALTMGAGFGGTETPPQVLARVPDLDAAEPAPPADPKPARRDGRMISQALSTKLLVGGGVLLVLAAIVPLMLGNRGSPKPDEQKLPAWHPGAPAPDAELAPTWNGGPTTGMPDSTGSTSPALTPNLQPAPPSMTFPPDVPPSADQMGTARDSGWDLPSQAPNWNERKQNVTPSPGSSHDYRRPPAEPGVARFNGIIEKPSVRTSYDRARSSVY